MKTTSLRIIIGCCLAVNTFFILFGTYLAIKGTQKSSQIQLEKIVGELAEQQNYADQFKLPPKQAKAYLSSIEFLQQYTGVLEEARDIAKSAGIFVLIPTIVAEIGLLLSLKQLRKPV